MEHLEFLIFYIFCLLVSSNLIKAWFETTFGEKILRLFFREEVSKNSSYEELTFRIKNSFFSDLLICPICLGTWITLLCSFCLSFVFDVNIFHILISTFSIPSISYILYLKRQ